MHAGRALFLAGGVALLCGVPRESTPHAAGGVSGLVLLPAQSVPYEACGSASDVSRCISGTWDVQSGACGCTGLAIQKPECRGSCGGCADQDVVCRAVNPVAPVCSCRASSASCVAMQPPQLRLPSGTVGSVIGATPVSITSVDKFASTLRASTHPCGNLNTNYSCPPPGDPAWFLRCTPLSEVSVGTASRIDLPLTTAGDYSVVERRVTAMSWSALYLASSLEATVAVIPKPTVLRVAGPAGGGGACAAGVTSRQLVVTQCADGMGIAFVGHDFSEGMRVVWVPVTLSQGGPYPTLPIPYNQVTGEKGFEATLSSGLSRSGGGAPPSCSSTSLGGLAVAADGSSLSAELRCSLSIPRDAVGVWSVSLEPTTPPTGLDPASDILQRGLLVSNPVLFDLDSHPFSPIISFALPSCDSDLGAALIGCASGPLRLTGIRPGTSVSVKLWPVTDPRFLPYPLQGSTTTAVGIPWGQPGEPPGEVDAKCLNYTELPDSFEAECWLDIPMEHSGWSALQVYANGGVVVEVPKAVLPAPRISGVSGGCAAAAGGVLSTPPCANGTQVVISGANLVVQAGGGMTGASSTTPTPTAAPLLPRVTLALFGGGAAPPPGPSCSTESATPQELRCVLHIPHGTSGDFAVGVVLPFGATTSATLLYSRWAPREGGALPATPPPGTPEGDTPPVFHLRIRGDSVPSIKAAVMESCTSPDTLQYCTDGVLRLKGVAGWLRPDGLSRVVFASPADAPSSSAVLPSCTSPLQRSGDGDGEDILCSIAFPQGGTGAYSFALASAADVGPPYSMLLRGRHAADLALPGFSFAFDPPPPPPGSSALPASLEVAVTHSEVQGLPPGYRCRLLWRTFEPQPAPAQRLGGVAGQLRLGTASQGVVGGEGGGAAVPFSGYMTTFSSRDTVILTPLQGARITTGVVRAQLFYAEVAASPAASAMYLMEEGVAGVGTGSPPFLPPVDEGYVIPETCQVGAWSNWSDCTRPCNTGVTYRNRSLVNGRLPPWFNPQDIGCPLLAEVQDCNIQSCLCDPTLGGREQCNDAGSCSPLGVCQCRSGVTGAHCTELVHGWRSKLLGFLLILAVATAGCHALASSHAAAVFLIAAECQVMAGYLRTACSPIDMREAGTDMGWITHPPRPSGMSGEVGALVWVGLLLFGFISVHLGIAVAKYSRVLRGRLYGAQSTRHAMKHGVDTEQLSRSMQKMSPKGKPRRGGSSSGAASDTTSRAEGGDDGSDAARQQKANQGEVGGILATEPDSTRLRDECFDEALARVRFPSLSIFFWGLCLFPLCFAAASAISLGGGAAVLGAAALAGGAVLPVALLAWFYVRRVHLDTAPHNRAALQQQQKQAQEEGFPTLRYTNSEHCLRGFYSESIYARAVVSGTLDNDTHAVGRGAAGGGEGEGEGEGGSDGDRVGVDQHSSATAVFIAPIPSHFYSSMYTADVGFKEKWGFALTAFSRQGYYFLPWYCGRIAVVASLLGAAPQAGEERRQCPPLFSVTILAHLLLLGLMLFMQPWCSRYYRHLMPCLAVLHIVLGALLVALSLVGFEETSALSTACQYFIVALLCALICVNLWGLVVWLLSRLNHVKALKEARALRIYFERQEEVRREEEAEQRRDEKLRVKREAQAQYLRSLTPPNPLLLLEQELSGGNKAKIANQRVVHSALDGSVMVTTLQPGTTLCQMERDETRAARILEADRVAADPDAPDHRFVFLDTSALPQEDLPAIGSVVRVVSAQGSGTKQFVGHTGIVRCYNTDAPQAYVVVEFRAATHQFLPHHLRLVNAGVAQAGKGHPQGDE